VLLGVLYPEMFHQVGFDVDPIPNHDDFFFASYLGSEVVNQWGNFRSFQKGTTDQTVNLNMRWHHGSVVDLA
jgi:hypothetical protein